MTNTDVEEVEGADGEEASALEKRARRMGWRPESEWDASRGNAPPKFLTAEEYLDKVENDLPVLRERNRFLDETVNKLDRKVTDLSKTLEESAQKLDESSGLVKTLFEQNKEVGKRAYEKARNDILAEKRAAVEAADTEAYDDASKREFDLWKEQQARERAEAAAEEAKPAPAAKPAPETRQEPAKPTYGDPITAAWVAENDWFEKDPVLQSYAADENKKIWAAAEAEGRTLTKLDALNETKRRVIDKFPERLGINPRRNGRGAVSESTTNGDGRRETPGKNFSDLPDDAKATYRSLAATFKAKGITYTEKEYVEHYQW